MPFKQVVNGIGNIPLATDLNQYALAMSKQADIGVLSLCAPSTAPPAPTLSIGSAGVLNGAYKYQLVYATGWKENNGNIWVSGFVPGPEASISPANQQVNGTAPVISAPIVATLVYRTAAGGASGTEKFAQALTSGLNWTDNLADGSLGTGMPSWYGTAIPANVPNANTTGTRLAQLSLIGDVIQGTTQYPTYTNNQITQILHKDSGGSVLRTDLFKYLTLQNLITNGNFANGTTGWTLGPGTSTGVSVANNILTLTPTAQWGGLYQAISYPDGHIIYASSYIKAPLANGENMQMWGGVPIVTLSLDNQWQQVSMRFSNTITTKNLAIGNTATSGLGAVSIKNIVAIDLTAIWGAGNEPTQAQMDAIMTLYGGFIDTTPAKRIEETRTLSTGEILSCAYNFDAYANLVAEVIT